MIGPLPPAQRVVFPLFRAAAGRIVSCILKRGLHNNAVSSPATKLSISIKS